MMDPQGTIYGRTTYGGAAPGCTPLFAFGCGTVFAYGRP